MKIDVCFTPHFCSLVKSSVLLIWVVGRNVVASVAASVVADSVVASVSASVVAGFVVASVSASVVAGLVVASVSASVVAGLVVASVSASVVAGLVVASVSASVVAGLVVASVSASVVAGLVVASVSGSVVIRLVVGISGNVNVPSVVGKPVNFSSVVVSLAAVVVTSGVLYWNFEVGPDFLALVTRAAVVVAIVVGSVVVGGSVGLGTHLPQHSVPFLTYISFSEHRPMHWTTSFSMIAHSLSSSRTHLSVTHLCSLTEITHCEPAGLYSWPTLQY